MSLMPIFSIRRNIHTAGKRTTVAAEQLNCIAFVGPLGEAVTELKASYPLQLSVRIDESRKSVIFDCFEYKPPFAIDLDDPDLTSYYPTNRAWERWTQAFMSHNINNDEDDYKDDYNDIDYYDGDILLDNKMIKEEGGGDTTDLRWVSWRFCLLSVFTIPFLTQQHCWYTPSNYLEHVAK